MREKHRRQNVHHIPLSSPSELYADITSIKSGSIETQTEVPHYLKTSDFLFGDYVPEPSKIKSANARKPNVELRRAIREIESGRHNKSTKSAAVEDNVPAFYKLQRDLYERGYD